MGQAKREKALELNIPMKGENELLAELGEE